jgi:predicted flap endonuclease-1-like 5' DNA nuclease
MVIESLRVEVLLLALVVLAAAAGFVGWVLHRSGEQARSRAHAATCQEFVNAAGRARDRARDESGQSSARLESLKQEHGRCAERIEQLSSALHRLREQVAEAEPLLGEHGERGRQLERLTAELAAERAARSALAERASALGAAEAERNAIRNAHAVCADTMQRLRDRIEELEERLAAREAIPPDGAPTWLLAAARGSKDDLKVVRGIGQALEREMNRLGIFHYDQVALLDAQSAQWLEPRLRVMPGTIERHRWAEQARLLAARERRASTRKHA